MQKSLSYSIILNDLEDKQLFFDSKTILQEIVQGNLETGISYHLIGEEGPDHNKAFHVEVRIGEDSYGTGYRKNEEGGGTGGGLSSHIEIKRGKGVSTVEACI